MAWSIFKQGGGDAVAVGWAQQFLTKLGAPVTPGNLQFIYQWEKAEGGGGKYNPLNTGPVAQHPEWTTTGEQFGGGAADYSSWETGLLGPKYYLEHYQQGTYSKILNALKSDNPTAARAALWASPWAASHYGYGSHWPNVPLPSGAAVLPSAGGLSEVALATGESAGGVVPVGNSEPNCAWNIGGPLGSYCVASKKQVRNTIGVVIITGGTIVGLIGVILLVVYGLTNTKAGDAVTQVIELIPGGSVLKKAL